MIGIRPPNRKEEKGGYPMAPLIVTTVGHVSQPPVGVRTFGLWMSVTDAFDGTPVSELSGANFSVKLFFDDLDLPQSSIDVPTMLPDLDDAGQPVLDADDNPQLHSIVRFLPQSGLYFLG